MKSPALFLAILLTSVALPGFSDDGSTLFSEGFEGGSSPFAKQLLSKKEVSLSRGKGPDGSDAIQVDYVGYSRGSQRVVMGAPLKRGVRSATLSFDVKFEDDFQFVRGGKLHGLGPTNDITGGKPRQPNGWSARIMFKEKGRCAYYLYDQDKSLKWGLEETARKPVFKAGQWQKVTFEVTVNDVGKSNGHIRILIDGKEISKERDVEFRGQDGPETLINQFIFSTFHGGHTADYAPKDKTGKFTTVRAWFDNFLVVESNDQQASLTSPSFPNRPLQR